MEMPEGKQEIPERIRRLLTNTEIRDEITARRNSDILDETESRLSSRDDGNRIGAHHEVRFYEALSDDALREGYLEKEIPGGKQIDLFLTEARVGVELYSPISRVLRSAPISAELLDPDRPDAERDDETRRLVNARSGRSRRWC